MVHARRQHPNAVLTPEGRRRMVSLVIDAGWTIEATAEQFQVDAKTVRTWRDRYRAEGPDGLLDRSSRPRSCPWATPQHLRDRALELRRQRRWGAAHIGHEVGLAASTVPKVLSAGGLARLDRGDRATAEPVRRYQREQPGELVHVDVKKLAAIPPGGGWRHHGRGNNGHHGHGGAGYRYLHSAIDDRTRLVYSEIFDDEQALTAARFWGRAGAWFAAQGVAVERVLTDNGSCYRSGHWHRACAATGTTVKRPDRADPRPTAKSNDSTGSSSRNGPTSERGTPTPNAPPRTTTSSTSTITTDPTAVSDGPPRSAPSPHSPGTTSPAGTTSRLRLSPRRPAG